MDAITILHVSDMQFGRNHRFGRLGLGGGRRALRHAAPAGLCDLDLVKICDGRIALKPEPRGRSPATSPSGG